MRVNLGAWGKVLIIAAIISVASITGSYIYLYMHKRQKLIIATTTSLYDTGLLDEIEKRFEEKNSIDLCFIPLGSGIAIQFAQRGDVDALLIHSPSQELKFLQDNYGVNRKIIAYNFFQIVGPKNDPAKIEGLSLVDALTTIASEGRRSQAIWISRGDNSGTHVKEKELWAAAGFDWTSLRDETNWFKETGLGMGKTLITANELSAYTLVDIGTFLAYSNKNAQTLLPNLKPLITQKPELLNVYSIIAVNKTKIPKVNIEAATTFTKFLISEEGQQIIANYGTALYGQSLFYPASNLLKNSTEPAVAQMIKNYAYFDGSECPPQFRYDHQELYG